MIGNLISASNKEEAGGEVSNEAWPLPGHPFGDGRSGSRGEIDKCGVILAEVMSTDERGKSANAAIVDITSLPFSLKKTNI
jgi:hypothetical protein